MTRTLAFYVGLATAVTVTVTMAVFAVVEHAGGDALPGALLQHALHIAVLGPGIYIVLRLLLARLVVAPIREVSAHLYRTGTGLLDPFEVSSKVREIRTLQSSVDIMVRRIELGRQAVDTTVAHLAGLREAARALGAVAPREAEEIMERTERLEAALQAAPGSWRPPRAGPGASSPPPPGIEP